MRVISMVPSWTETLLSAGVDVVGRTRYCIHPRDCVARIPVVGGTKDIKWPAVRDLNADLLILDQEENPRVFAERSVTPVWASHITSVRDLPKAHRELGRLLDSPQLLAMGDDWQRVIAVEPVARSIFDLPGVLQWWRQPEAPIERILYLIWRNPWMTVSSSTFIGSVLSHLGYGALLPMDSERYPRIDLGDFDAKRTLLLFSSEPYAFAKERDELVELGFAAALVDGESYSWFGVRSLNFLKSLKS